MSRQMQPRRAAAGSAPNHNLTQPGSTWKHGFLPALGPIPIPTRIVVHHQRLEGPRSGPSTGLCFVIRLLVTQRSLVRATLFERGGR